MRVFVAIGVAFAVGLGLGQSLASAQANGGSCVRSQCNTRYVAYGYNHIVHLDNTCGRPMVCSVASDANPAATRVTLAAGASNDVQTFVGSPARECRAVVSCSPQ